MNPRPLLPQGFLEMQFPLLGSPLDPHSSAALLQPQHNHTVQGTDFSFPFFITQYTDTNRASLVVQQLRIHLPMQGTRVQFLVQEDPTCRGAASPCATAAEAHVLQTHQPQEKPLPREALTLQLESSPHHHRKLTQQKDPVQPNINN